jgi:phosphoserine phosphatase RsbU/P
LNASVRCVCSRLRRFGALGFIVVRAACFSLAFAAPVCVAQTFDAADLHEPASLAAPWLVHAGDDPAYARANFDDSHWLPFNAAQSLHTILPGPRPEVVWYRIHVRITPPQTGMAVAATNISSAYEIYVNGERLIQSGRVSPFAAFTSTGHLLRPLPGAQLASGTLVVAVRAHMAPMEWEGPLPGLGASSVMLGQSDALKIYTWYTVAGQSAGQWLDHMLIISLGVVSLALYSVRRRQTEYLLISMAGLAIAVTLAITCNSLFQNISAGWLIVGYFFSLMYLFCCVFTFVMMCRGRIGRGLRLFLFLLSFASLIASAGAFTGRFSLFPVALTFGPLYLALPTVVTFTAIRQIRRGDREAAILLIPATFWFVYAYLYVIAEALSLIPAAQSAGVRLSELIGPHTLGPLSIDPSYVSDISFWISLSIILLLRTLRLSRSEAMHEGELAAAREVQQVILPEQVESVPGFQVESVYRPAQQVGGDFFQVLPDQNGGLLVVVGDVAGKGLPAAMLVSVLVGAVRTAAAYSHKPDEILAQLNERLLGRTQGGFSTALCAHISADGQVTVANAGHLSPYLDGIEVELPGALPLGVLNDVRYESTRFPLGNSSRLAFYSDGVVEAQNQKGELFGFDRARSISTQPAAAIAEAARQFGQEDDITVVTIERLAAIEDSASVGSAPMLVPA